MTDVQERMFRRLVQNIRSGFPDLLSRPFEVSAIHQHLIPYRLNRGELGLDSAEDYELALMRLLSGAGGLLEGDPEMQAALRTELDSTNPDLSAFRAWGTSTVSVSMTAVRALDNLTPVAVRSPSSSAPTRQAEIAGRATLELPTSSVTATMMASTQLVTPPDSMTAAPAVPAPAHAHGTGCRYCGGELPDGRDASFCPHCGQNLSVKQCPACSTELEVEWQFCITCGRQVE